MVQYTLRHCLYHPFSEWNWQEIKQLSSIQLEALCRILGIPHSGTKAERFERIKAAAEVRQFLTDQTVENLRSLPKKILVEQAKKVGVIHWLNKQGIAASLLNWRNQCRSDGQKFIAQMQEEIKAKGKRQLALNLFD